MKIYWWQKATSSGIREKGFWLDRKQQGDFTVELTGYESESLVWYKRATNGSQRRTSSDLLTQEVGRNGWSGDAVKTEISDRVKGSSLRKSVVRAQKQGWTQGGRFRLIESRVRQQVVVRMQRKGLCPEFRIQENFQWEKGKKRNPEAKRMNGNNLLTLSLSPIMPSLSVIEEYLKQDHHLKCMRRG